MPLPDLPDIGDDAFSGGFLSKGFAGKFTAQVRALCNWTVSLPPGAGTAQVIVSGENVILDLTKLAIFPGVEVIIVVNGQETTVQIPIKIVSTTPP